MRNLNNNYQLSIVNYQLTKRKRNRNFFPQFIWLIHFNFVILSPDNPAGLFISYQQATINLYIHLLKQKSMKIKQLLTKTLLVAAGLLAGASAWADVTPFSESYSSTSTTDGWSTSVSGRFNPAILNEEDNYFLSVAQDSRNNNGAVVTGTIINGKAVAGLLSRMLPVRVLSSP